MTTYEPLPESLRIQASEIDGHGLFTLKFLKQDTNLGVSHIVLNQDLRKYEKGTTPEIIRTPLGGFVNHSDKPNCIKVKKDDRYYLKTIKDVIGGDELTVKYTFYNIKTESEKMQEELEPILETVCPMSDE